MKKKHTTIIRDIAIYVAVSVMLLAGIAGIHAWPTDEHSIGYFTYAKNPWGIAIYQPGIHTTIQWNGYTVVSQTGTTLVLKMQSVITPSMDFGRDDIIFDDEGNLYTESKESEIQTIHALSGMIIQKMQNSEKNITTGATQFFLINPHIPGVLKITFPNHSMTSINLDTKKITNTVNTPIVIKIYDQVPTVGTL